MESSTEANQFQTLQSSLKTALLQTTRTTNAITSEDLSFHRSLDPSLAKSLDEQNARLLNLASRLLGNAAQSTDVVGSTSTSASKLKIADSEELEANWRGVVDVVDSLLERADVTLDEFRGVLKKGGEAAATEVCYFAHEGGLEQGF